MKITHALLEEAHCSPNFEKAVEELRKLAENAGLGGAASLAFTGSYVFEDSKPPVSYRLELTVGEANDEEQ